jgi:hypothetical protein
MLDAGRPELARACDVYDGPIRAMLVTYPEGVHGVSYEQLYARWHSAPDFRRAIDAARAEAAAEMRAELDEAKATIATLRECGSVMVNTLLAAGVTARRDAKLGEINAEA